MRSYALASLILLGGCATAPITAETEREIVLQHVAVDAGTAGPFTKKSKHELDILSANDRVEAAALLDHVGRQPRRRFSRMSTPKFI